MGVLTYVLGRSGTGKSYSMRNFKKGEIGVINVQGKILPFKGSGSFDIVNTDDSSSIVKNIKIVYSPDSLNKLLSQYSYFIFISLYFIE